MERRRPRTRKKGGINLLRKYLKKENKKMQRGTTKKNRTSTDIIRIVIIIFLFSVAPQHDRKSSTKKKLNATEIIRAIIIKTTCFNFHTCRSLTLCSDESLIPHIRFNSNLKKKQ